MTRQILKVGAVLMLVFATVTAGTHGMTPIMKVNIPFDFQIKENRLPAGRYTVVNHIQSTLAIRGEANGKAVFFHIYGGKSERRAGNPRLEFRRYGDQYFLGAIWDGSSNVSMELGKSSAEREVQAQQRRNLAQNSSNPETVTVLGETGN